MAWDSSMKHVPQKFPESRKIPKGILPMPNLVPCPISTATRISLLPRGMAMAGLKPPVELKPLEWPDGVN